MNNYTVFPCILKRPKRADVLRRLGYNKKVEISKSDMQDIELSIEKAEQYCMPSARIIYMPIIARSNNEITLENGIVLISDKLARMLINSEEVLIMGATLGSDVSKKIEDELRFGDKVFSVILDGYASESVDSALDFVMQCETQKLVSKSQVLTKHRFSPGYGNLDMRFQKDLFEMLRFEEMGVTITDSYMLMPEKSVIALAGVKTVNMNN